MSWYITWVAANPLWSAAVQFGILGTLGEVLSLLIHKKPLTALGAWRRIILKVIAWGILGLTSAPKERTI